MAAGATAPISVEDLPPPPPTGTGGLRIAVAGDQPQGGYLNLPAPAPNQLALPSPQPTYLNTIFGHEGTGQNPRSSAFGYGQFIRDTWMGFAKANPQMFQGMSEDEILAKRSDPAYGAQATNWLAQQNAAELQRRGVSPTGQSLGISHYLGAGPAAAVMGAPDTDPISKYVGQAALTANPELTRMTVAQMKARYANTPNPEFLGGGPSQHVALAATSTSPANQASNPLSLPPPPPPPDMKQMWTMMALQTLLPKGMGFHPVDYDPRKAMEVGRTPLPRVDWGGFRPAHITLGEGGGAPMMPAISPQRVPQQRGRRGGTGE